MEEIGFRKFASIAEIIGGLAVLITLVVLILEIRENTEATKRANYETLMQELRDWRELTISSDRVNSVFIQGFDNGIQPNPGDQNIYNQMFNVLWSIYESAYFFNESNDLGENEWERFRSNICSGNNVRWDCLRRYLASEFVEFVESCRVEPS